MCLSQIGRNVFARSGRKREEMGSDKFRFFSGCVSRLKAGGETRLPRVGILAGGQLGCTLSPGGSANPPWGWQERSQLLFSSDTEEAANQPLYEPPVGSEWWGTVPRIEKYGFWQRQASRERDSEKLMALPSMSQSMAVLPTGSSQ